MCATPEVARERRRQRREQAHQLGKQPNKDILTRDGWHIVITNVGEELMETSEIAQLYSVRWQIEIIFRPGSSPVNLSRPSQGPAIRFIWRRSCMGPYYC